MMHEDRTVALPRHEKDDPAFVERVERILSGVLISARPSEAYAVRIDHGFDHKWLAFAGKLGYAARWRSGEVLTIPPFVPNRVVDARRFAWDESVGAYRQQDPSDEPLHLRQASIKNIPRQLRGRWDSVVLAWYSGETESKGRGSLMVYTFTEQARGNWMLTLAAQNGWRPGRMKHVSARELEYFERLGANDLDFRTGEILHSAEYRSVQDGR